MQLIDWALGLISRYLVCCDIFQYISIKAACSFCGTYLIVSYTILSFILLKVIVSCSIMSFPIISCIKFKDVEYLQDVDI